MKLPFRLLYGFLMWLTLVWDKFTKPARYIGGKDNPYLSRWYIIPRNNWFNIYLHKFTRSDDDRALHDHPWWNVSVILKGWYWEIISNNPELLIPRVRGNIVFRKATQLHRIELPVEGYPVWTLFITGPRIREWGFQCPQGWIPWYEFVDPNNPDLPGRGCD